MKASTQKIIMIAGAGKQRNEHFLVPKYHEINNIYRTRWRKQGAWEWGLISRGSSAKACG